MTVAEVEAALLQAYGVRAGAAVVRYVAGRVGGVVGEGFPVLAGDARTGLAVRRVVVPATLLAAQAAGPSAAH